MFDHSACFSRLPPDDQYPTLVTPKPFLVPPSPSMSPKSATRSHLSQIPLSSLKKAAYVSLFRNVVAMYADALGFSVSRVRRVDARRWRREGSKMMSVARIRSSLPKSGAD